MTVAIIVPTKSVNAWPAETMLPLLKETVKGLDVKIITIESSGSDFSFAKSVNKGISQVPDAEAYILLNDDCFMRFGWLDAMLASVEKHPEIGVFGAILGYPDGRIQHVGGYVASNIWEVVKEWTKLIMFGGRPFWAFGRIFAGHLGFTNHYRTRSPGRIDYITGACMLITRKCVCEVGLFDEAYPLGYEDTDYCLRAKMAGFGICVVPDAFGIHLEGVSTGRGIDDRKARSFEIFSERWRFDKRRQPK